MARYGAPLSVYGSVATRYGQDDLVAETGSFGVTGMDAEFTKGLILSAQKGKYLVSGKNALLGQIRGVFGDAGGYGWIGKDARLYRPIRRLPAVEGSFTLTGGQPHLFRRFILNAKMTSYSVAGMDVYVKELPIPQFSNSSGPDGNPFGISSGTVQVIYTPSSSGYIDPYKES